MFRSLTLAAALAAGLALSSAAAAQTFDPKPASYTLVGPVTFIGSLNVTCTVTVNFSVDAAGVETVTSRSVAGGAPCNLVTPYGAWVVDAGPGLSTVTLTLGFSAGASACYGTTPAALAVMSSSSTASFGPVLLPPVGSGSACMVRGALTSTAPLAIVP